MYRRKVALCRVKLSLNQQRYQMPDLTAAQINLVGGFDKIEWSGATSKAPSRKQSCSFWCPVCASKINGGLKDQERHVNKTKEGKVATCNEELFKVRGQRRCVRERRSKTKRFGGVQTAVDLQNTGPTEIAAMRNRRREAAKRVLQGEEHFLLPSIADECMQEDDSGFEEVDAEGDDMDVVAEKHEEVQQEQEEVQQEPSGGDVQEERTPVILLLKETMTAACDHFVLMEVGFSSLSLLLHQHLCVQFNGV